MRADTRRTGFPGPTRQARIVESRLSVGADRGPDAATDSDAGCSADSDPDSEVEQDRTTTVERHEVHGLCFAGLALLGSVRDRGTGAIVESPFIDGVGVALLIGFLLCGVPVAKTMLAVWIVLLVAWVSLGIPLGL